MSNEYNYVCTNKYQEQQHQKILKAVEVDQWMWGMRASAKNTEDYDLKIAKTTKSTTAEFG